MVRQVWIRFWPNPSTLNQIRTATVTEFPNSFVGSMLRRSFFGASKELPRKSSRGLSYTYIAPKSAFIPTYVERGREWLKIGSEILINGDFYKFNPNRDIKNNRILRVKADPTFFELNHDALIWNAHNDWLIPVPIFYTNRY